MRELSLPSPPRVCISRVVTWWGSGVGARALEGKQGKNTLFVQHMGVSMQQEAFSRFNLSHAVAFSSYSFVRSSSDAPDRRLHWKTASSLLTYPPLS